MKVICGIGGRSIRLKVKIINIKASQRKLLGVDTIKYQTRNPENYDASSRERAKEGFIMAKRTALAAKNIIIRLKGGKRK